MRHRKLTLIVLIIIAAIQARSVAAFDDQPSALGSLAAQMKPRIRLLLERCLRKDAQQRLHSIADARIVLEEVLRGEVDEPGTASGIALAPPRPRWQVLAALAVAALAGAALTYLAGRVTAPAAAPSKVLRFEIPQPPELVAMGAPKVSPDGRHIAFGGRDKSGKAQVWVRSLDSTEARPLPGTEGHNSNGRPFWSPDSRFVALFTADKLIKVPIDGGPAQKISDGTGADGSWSDQGLILFDGTAATPITGVSAGGGTSEAGDRGGRRGKGSDLRLAAVPAGRRSFPLRRALGERRRCAASGWPGPTAATAGAWSRGSRAPSTCRPAGCSSCATRRSSPSVSTRRAARSRARRFRSKTDFALRSIGLAEFSVSRDGVLATRAGGGATELFGTFDRKGDARQPRRSKAATWATRSSRPTAAGWPSTAWPARQHGHLAARPEARRELAIHDLTGRGDRAALRPDGERIVFARVSGDKTLIVSRPIAVGDEVVLTTADGVSPPVVISPDGRTLVFAVQTDTDLRSPGARSPERQPRDADHPDAHLPRVSRRLRTRRALARRAVERVGP